VSLLFNLITAASLDFILRRARANVHRSPMHPFTYTRACVNHAHYEWTGHYNRRGGLRQPVTLPDDADTDDDDEMPSLVELVSGIDI
jgi:hypothetical protein